MSSGRWSPGNAGSTNLFLFTGKRKRRVLRNVIDRRWWCKGWSRSVWEGRKMVRRPRLMLHYWNWWRWRKCDKGHFYSLLMVERLSFCHFTLVFIILSIWNCFFFMFLISPQHHDSCPCSRTLADKPGNLSWSDGNVFRMQCSLASHYVFFLYLVSYTTIALKCHHRQHDAIQLSRPNKNDRK